LLYNANLISFDRETDSHWSQILSESVKGSLICTKAPRFFVLETTWKAWLEMFPKTKVVSTNTGFQKPYDRSTFGLNLTSGSGLIFPIKPRDERLWIYERVYGVVNERNAKVYQFEQFEKGTQLLVDEFQNEPVVIVGSKERNFIVSFKQKQDNTLLNFEIINDPDPSIIMQDAQGNKWNVFGEAVSGPRTGERLIQTESFMGYWFSFGGFFPDAEIFNNELLSGG